MLDVLEIDTAGSWRVSSYSDATARGWIAAFRDFLRRGAKQSYPAVMYPRLRRASRSRLDIFFFLRLAGPRNGGERGRNRKTYGGERLPRRPAREEMMLLAASPHLAMRRRFTASRIEPPHCTPTATMERARHVRDPCPDCANVHKWPQGFAITVSTGSPSDRFATPGMAGTPGEVISLTGDRASS